MNDVTLADVEAAARRIAGAARRTPVLEWRPRPGLPGIGQDVRVVLKLENLQLGGSFKLRGALNAVALAGDAARRGLVTASGGNHGIGVALAGQRVGAPVTVCVPQGTSAAAEEVLRRLGAVVLRGGAVWDDAWARAQEEAGRSGALLIHPYDDPAVIAGQGTLALELLEDVPEVDLVLCAVGGGGLLGGVGTVLQARGRARLLGVEPTGADAMARSLEAGAVVRLERVDTIATSLAPRGPSPRTLRLCQALCAGVVRVSDDEIRAAQALMWQDLRQQVEPAGAAALAAALAGRIGPWLAGVRTLAIIVCGANA